MMDVKKQLEYFKGLSYEVKREKVIDMLKKLQWTHETFAMFYKKITTIKNIKENILMYVYQGIFEVANALEVGNKVEAEDKIKHMADVLMAIRKQEETEMQREWNPDELLKNL